MDLFDVVRSCFRRWYIVLPLLAMTAWFCHHMYTSVKPVYYSNAVISMAPPGTRTDVSPNGSPVPRNGLLDVGGAGLIANLTAIGLRDPSVIAQVVAAGGQPSYFARIFPVPPNSPQLPLILIEATEADPAAASTTVEAVVAQADPTLQRLQQQANVPDDQMVKSFTVSPPSVPTPGVPSRTRSTIVVGVAGAGIAVLVAVVVDLLLLRWKSRRQKRRQSRVQTPDGAEPPQAAQPPLEPASTYESAPAHRTDPAHGADPAEVYSQNKHAAADQLWNDKR